MTKKQYYDGMKKDIFLLGGVIFGNISKDYQKAKKGHYNPFVIFEDVVEGTKIGKFYKEQTFNQLVKKKQEELEAEREALRLMGRTR